MTDQQEKRLTQAIDWAVRVQDPQFEDWDAHGEWLTSDPRNVDAYHQAVLHIDDGIAVLPKTHAPDASMRAANDVRRPAVAGRRAWISGAGLALAASFAAIVVLQPTDPGTPARFRTISTARGETREVAMSDGTQIFLNGDTSIRIASAGTRLVRLERGEAFFRVTHNAARPFELTAGNARFRDVGTRFNAVHDGGSVRLAIQEGAVLFDPDGRKLRLNAGRAIEIGAQVAALSSVAPETVGAWREGRLIFKDVPLSSVAEDVGRASGTPISIAPQLRNQRFSGVIPTRGGIAAPVRLGQLIGEPAHNVRGIWLIGD